MRSRVQVVIFGGAFLAVLIAGLYVFDGTKHRLRTQLQHPASQQATPKVLSFEAEGLQLLIPISPAPRRIHSPAAANSFLPKAYTSRLATRASTSTR